MRLAFTKPNTYSGILLRDCMARDIVIATDVSWVDIVNAPNLLSISIRSEEPVHLSISGCPALHRILLPEAERGSVLHVDFGADETALFVAGTIRSIDTCSQLFEPTAVAAKEAPFQGAQLLHNSSAVDLLRNAHKRQLSIFQGISGDTSAKVISLLKDLRGLILTNSNLPQVALDYRSAEFIRFSSLPDLAKITMQGRVRDLEIENCPLVDEISGSGRTMRMRNASTTALSIFGMWDRGIFENVGAQLHAEAVASIMAMRCSKILPSHLDMGNATNPLGILPTPEAIKEEKWQALLLNWVMVTELRSSALAGLRLLKALHEAGVCARSIKEARTALKLNVSTKAAKKRKWAWPATELEVETYHADLQLLKALAEDQAVTLQEISELGPFENLAQMIAVTKLLRDGDDELVCDFLEEGLAQSIESFEPRKIMRSRREDMRQKEMIKPFVEGLFALRKRGEFGRMLTKLPGLLRKLCGETDALPYIALLCSYGLKAARKELLREAQNLKQRNSNLSSSYLAAAMAPAQSTLLAEIE